MLQISHVSKTFNPGTITEKQALHDINLTLEDGDFCLDIGSGPLTVPIALYLLSDAYAKGNGVDKDLEKSKFYADYLEMIRQPKIDKKREKNAKKLAKEKEKEK